MADERDIEESSDEISTIRPIVRRSGQGQRQSTGEDHERTIKLARPRQETPAPLPPAPAAAEAEVWLQQALTPSGSIPDLGAMISGTDPTSSGAQAATHSKRPRSDARVPAPTAGNRLLGAHPRLLLTLIAATCLAAGMVLGALLFGSQAAGRPGPGCPDPSLHQPPAAPLPEPPGRR